MDKLKSLVDDVAFLKGLTSNTFALVALGILGPLAALIGKVDVTNWITFAVLCLYVAACLGGAVIVAWRDHGLKAAKKYDDPESPAPPANT